MDGNLDLESRNIEMDYLLDSVKRDEKYASLLSERVRLIRQMEAKLYACKYNMSIYNACKERIEQIDIKLRGYRLGLTEFDA